MPWAVVTAHLPTTLPVPANLGLAWRQSPYRGDRFAGDALGVETGRGDGRVQVLLFDVTGHGEPASETIEFVDTLLADPALSNLAPADLRYMRTVFNRRKREEKAGSTIEKKIRLKT